MSTLYSVPRGYGSRRPTLIRKTEGAVVAENNVVKDGNADEVAGLTEPGGEHTV